VLPLLAPDAPVVTWWYGSPPDLIAHDPLGVSADRRVTDVLRAEDPAAALRQRAEDYRPGDTDLAWTRTTPWRAELASAFDTVRSSAKAAAVVGRRDDPADAAAGRLAVGAAGLRGAGRAGRRAGARGRRDRRVRVRVELADGGVVELTRRDAGRWCCPAPTAGQRRRAARARPR
jgi:hypothetical protein